MLIQDTPRLRAFIDELCIPRTNGLNKINILTKYRNKTTYIFLQCAFLNLHLTVYMEFECFPSCLFYNHFCTYFRCDDATYPGSHSGTATAGYNQVLSAYLMVIDAVVRVLSFFLQSVLKRIDRHICKTVMQQTSFRKINLGK